MYISYYKPLKSQYRFWEDKRGLRWYLQVESRADECLPNEETMRYSETAGRGANEKTEGVT